MDEESARISNEFELERFKLRNPDISRSGVRRAKIALNDKWLRKVPMSKVNVELEFQAFFVSLEKESEQSIAETLATASDSQIIEVVSDLQHDIGDLMEIERSHGVIVERYFHRKGIVLVNDDEPRLQNFTNQMRLALLENAQRNLVRLRGDIPVCENILFRDLSARSPLHAISTIGNCAHPLSELCERHYADLSQTAKRGSLKSFPATYRILKEVFGADREVSQITQEDIRSLLEMLERCPKNAKQRFPKLSFIEAIERCDGNQNVELIGRKTQKHYLDRIRLVFEAAVNYEWVGNSPVKKHFSKRFDNLPDVETPQFTVEELNKLFRAPLYSGCVDDMQNYKKPGVNNPRRGRFWLPLLALFQGVRLAEACQLYSHDVGEEDGIPYISITLGETEDEREIKSLKTKSSNRKVPVHKELIRMGFMNYVDSMKGEGEERLFPEISISAGGSLSENMTKWFSRFVESVFQMKVATFHSLRHTYRDGLRNSALTTTEVAEALGGWGIGGRSLEAHYGKGYKLKVLQDEIEKLEYKGLDLSHLYQE